MPRSQAIPCWPYRFQLSLPFLADEPCRRRSDNAGWVPRNFGDQDAVADSFEIGEIVANHDLQRLLLDLQVDHVVDNSVDVLRDKKSFEDPDLIHEGPVSTVKIMTWGLAPIQPIKMLK